MNFQLLKTPMLKCFEYWIENESISENFGISKIPLKPKKDNLHKIQSWRPHSTRSFQGFSRIELNR